MTKTYITDDMRSVIGKEFNEQISFPIGANDIRRWAIATYYPDEPPRIFWDDDYAAASKYGTIVAPEEFNPFGWMTKKPAGLRRGGTDPSLSQGRRAEKNLEGVLGIEGPGLDNPLNGGQTTEYTGVRMRPGDVIRAVTAVSDYFEREGKLGLMLFTEQTTTWTNQNGEVVKISKSILIRY
ncbi:MAG: MaoC family dehydratase N-terminal domain-containing protein [Acidimicrobiia bacterium]